MMHGLANFKVCSYSLKNSANKCNPWKLYL